MEPSHDTLSPDVRRKYREYARRYARTKSDVDYIQLTQYLDSVGITMPAKKYLFDYRDISTWLYLSPKVINADFIYYGKLKNSKLLRDYKTLKRRKPTREEISETQQ